MYMRCAVIREARDGMGNGGMPNKRGKERVRTSEVFWAIILGAAAAAKRIFRPSMQKWLFEFSFGWHTCTHGDSMFTSYLVLGKPRF